MKLSKILSTFFHPVFMPLFGLVVIFNSGIYESGLPVGYIKFLYIIVFLCNVLSIIPVLIYIKQIQNLEINERSERIIPLFFASMCFYIGYYIVSVHSQSILVNLFMLSTTAVVVVVLLVSLFWKISIHMAGIGGITGLIIILSYVFRADILILLCVVILISGILASARLASGSHSLLQVIAGYLLGLLGVLGLMFQFVF
jgi:hypothetical protein